MLVVNDVTKKFGGMIALNNLSLEVRQGEILGIIGPNGAGKSTMFNVICGFYPVNSGQIIYKDKEITRLRPDQICHLGIGRTFQQLQALPSFSVLETVLTAGLSRLPFKESMKQAREILERVGLASVAELSSVALPPAQQRILGVAEALATQPELMLLDEAMTGLSRLESKDIIKLIHQLNGEGITFAIVEHTMHIIMNLCQRVVVLNFGCNTAEGTPSEIIKNKDVVDAYLGAEVDFA